MRAHFPFLIALSVGAFACTKSTAQGGPVASASAPLPSVSSVPSSADAASSNAASPTTAERPDASLSSAGNGSTGVVLADAGNAVRDALVARDMHRFAAFVHPTRGVRFSPYAYVETKADVVLRASELETAFASNAKRTWGAFDGSGEPIVLTFRAYLARFVAFSELARLAPRLDGSVAAGNTFNNQREVYGSAPYVEYYSAGKNGGSDWEALRIVFEAVDGKLFVVGIIHDVWTI